jgi:hypothetical protein
MMLETLNALAAFKILGLVGNGKSASAAIKLGCWTVIFGHDANALNLRG